MCYHRQPYWEGGLIDLVFWPILLKILFISTPNSTCLMSVPISLYSISFIFQFSLILFVINQPRNIVDLSCVLSFFFLLRILKKNKRKMKVVYTSLRRHHVSTPKNPALSPPLHQECSPNIY